MIKIFFLCYVFNRKLRYAKYVMYNALRIVRHIIVSNDYMGIGKLKHETT